MKKPRRKHIKTAQEINMAELRLGLEGDLENEQDKDGMEEAKREKKHEDLKGLKEGKELNRDQERMERGVGEGMESIDMFSNCKIYSVDSERSKQAWIESFGL